jgi:hypothetical protein
VPTATRPRAVQASEPAVRQAKSRQISAEHELIQELERKVESWRRKVLAPELPAEPGNRDYSAPRAAQVELLKSKEAALEKNVERLYCAAKRRVTKQDEELHELSTHERARTER